MATSEFDGWVTARKGQIWARADGATSTITSGGSLLNQKVWTLIRDVEAAPDYTLSSRAVGAVERIQCTECQGRGVVRVPYEVGIVTSCSKGCATPPLESLPASLCFVERPIRALAQAFSSIASAMQTPRGRRLLSRQNVQQVIDAHRGQPFHTAFTAGMVAWCENFEERHRNDPKDFGMSKHQLLAEACGARLVAYELARGGLTNPRHEPDCVATRAYERARGGKQ